MSYNFTQVANTRHYEISLDPEACYGYFEHHVRGDESAGGLWFDKLDDGRLELRDYDGVFELPAEVAAALQGMGCFVPDEYFA